MLKNASENVKAFPPEPSPEEMVDLLLSLDHSAQASWLAETIPALSAPAVYKIAKSLKKQADLNLRVNLEISDHFATLILLMSDIRQDRQLAALSYRAKGNVQALGYGNHQQGLAFYDDAIKIYHEFGLVHDEALSQIGKIWSLASLGRSDEALAIAEWASAVVAAEADWQSLATLTINMGIIYGRLGNDTDALQQFNKARTLYKKLGEDGQTLLPMIQINRAIVLRNLGQFAESITSLQNAVDMYRDFGQSVGVARAQQNLAMTFFVIGRYNEALALLEEARTTYLNDGRQRDAMLVEIFTSDCLLQLRRYPDVLKKCQESRQLFTHLGTQLEMGQALLNEAIAYVGLQAYDAALNSLAEARTLFLAEKNAVAVADADLQEAAVLLLQENGEAALNQALACARIFQAHHLPIGEARAYLTAAKAAMHLSNLDQAAGLAEATLQIGKQHRLPTLKHQAHYLQGTLAALKNEPESALAKLKLAIEELEQLYGRLMIEFRADFVADKEHIYQDAVGLCLKLEKPEKGLEFCERAKSRALQDMLSHRLNLRIEARSPEDQPAVDQLLALRQERDRLHRRWATSETPGQREGMDEALSAQHRVGQAVLDLEKQITDLWHTLLIRNADYARDAALWQVQTKSAQPYLPDTTLLLEYFSIRDQLVLFLVTASAVKAVWLPDTVQKVQNLLQLFRLNLKAVPHGSPSKQVHLEKNAQGVLKKLYQLLLAPAASELSRFDRLIIVPHGSLHYLPFHALHNGKTYLIQTHEVSYLPGSSLITHGQKEEASGQTEMVAIGNSHNGLLPHAVAEAQTVANLWKGEVMVETAAVLSSVKEAAERTDILHLATHGDFRADNPLFSGLALADGWLTTLDIFNLRLSASLVTLSACQTGRSVISGGDELLGLLRAFLTAGAASLVATLWAVEDQSTAKLMKLFYEKLLENRPKGAALRLAQLEFINDSAFQSSFRHPYFWAPFFLVGDANYL